MNRIHITVVIRFAGGELFTGMFLYFSLADEIICHVHHVYISIKFHELVYIS